MICYVRTNLMLNTDFCGLNFFHSIEWSFEIFFHPLFFVPVPVLVTEPISVPIMYQHFWLIFEIVPHTINTEVSESFKRSKMKYYIFIFVMYVRTV